MEIIPNINDIQNDLLIWFFNQGRLGNLKMMDLELKLADALSLWDLDCGANAPANSIKVSTLLLEKMDDNFPRLVSLGRSR